MHIFGSLYAVFRDGLLRGYMAVRFFHLIIADERTDKDAIIAFVLENEEALLESIRENDFTCYENHAMICDVDVKENVVDFSCDGMGIGSDTCYVGFYYTEHNDMTAIWCAPSSAGRLISSGKGFEWQEEKGDNRYYTEKICEGF